MKVLFWWERTPDFRYNSGMMVNRRTFLAFSAALCAQQEVGAKQPAQPKPKISPAEDVEVVNESYRLSGQQGTLQFNLVRDVAKGAMDCTVRIFNNDRDVSFRLAVNAGDPKHHTTITSNFWDASISYGLKQGSVILNEKGAVVFDEQTYVSGFYKRIQGMLSGLAQMSPETRQKEIATSVEQMNGLIEDIHRQLLPSPARQVAMRLINSLRASPKP